jgi:molecular chaperone GrpE
MSEQDTPADWEADGEEANATVDKLLEEIQGLKEQVLRYAAEAENTKRRAEREANDARAYAITKFARDLLGVADIFDRAMAAAPGGAEAAREELRRRRRDDRQGAAGRPSSKNGLKKIDPPRARSSTRTSTRR